MTAASTTQSVWAPMPEDEARSTLAAIGVTDPDTALDMLVFTTPQGAEIADLIGARFNINITTGHVHALLSLPDLLTDSNLTEAAGHPLLPSAWVTSFLQTPAPAKYQQSAAGRRAVLHILAGNAALDADALRSLHETAVRTDDPDMLLALAMNPAIPADVHLNLTNWVSGRGWWYQHHALPYLIDSSHLSTGNVQQLADLWLSASGEDTDEAAPGKVRRVVSALLSVTTPEGGPAVSQQTRSDLMLIVATRG